MTQNDISARGPVAAASRAIIWGILALAALTAAAILVLGTISLVSSIADGRVSTILTTGTALPPEADQGPAVLVSGSYETAHVVVDGLDGGILALSVIARALGLLTQVAVAAALALLCWSLVKAAPFRRSLSITVTASGAVVLVGGLLSGGLGVLSSWMIAEELNAPDAGLDGFWPIMASIDPTFVVLGIALLLVGLAFDYGERLQRDTAGLV